MCGTHSGLTFTTLAALCLLGGCTQRPEFSEREEITQLIPEARTFANQQLANRFGSVTAPIAWEQLPLQYHAASATIADDPGGRKFAVNITHQSLPVEPGDEVLWLSWQMRQEAGIVENYDSESQTILLSTEIAFPPYTQEFDRPEEVITQGTLTLQDGSASPVTLTIDASNATLQGLAGTINAAGLHVGASIRSVGSEDKEAFRLLLTGNDAAHTNNIRIRNDLAASGEGATRPVFDVLSEGDRLALGPGKVLQHGRLLYAEHCQHCHGVSGDGAGPTAEYLNPRPRDYRNGTFKFTSTITGRRARRDDLARTIENGIPGTYMPSFKLLEPDEMTAIVEYVLWLSMRGETEGKLATLLGEYSTVDIQARANQQLADQQKQLADYQAALERARSSSAPAGDVETVEGAIEIISHNIEIAQADAAEPNRIALRPFVNQFDYLLQDTDADVEAIVSDWNNAYDESALVIPKTPRTPSDPESIARGRLVFLNPNAKCASCHGDAGLGNGDQTRAVQQGETEPGLFDEWGNPIQPRNLTSGIYRGGRRPLDIYRRIHSGIKGTPMAGFATALTEEQIWDLVNYVLSIPFEDRELGAGAEVAGETPLTEDVAANQSTPPSVADN